MAGSPILENKAPNAANAQVDLAGRLRVAITRLNRRLRQQSLAGLSPAQASTLGMIDRMANPTLGELALAEQVQPPTMTRLIASMEEADLVVRKTDAADRRVCRVQLSPEGKKTLQRIRSLKDAYLTRRLASLDPGELVLAESMIEFLEHLEAEP
jgi:DNA-binding MarR family transcriptional regulator